MRFQGILGLLLLEFIRILGLHCAEEKENEKSHVSVNFEVDMGPWWLSGKESACNTGDLGSIPRSPGEGMATHSSIIVWIIPWTEHPGRLQCTGSQRVGHD